MEKSSSGTESDGRLLLKQLGSLGGGSTFTHDVKVGLSSNPKFLKPKYFYDELGSILFEAICLLPEYYPTRTEREILLDSAPEMAAAVDGPVRLVELGSGSSLKSRIVIEALLARQDSLHYLPIDISESALQRSARELLQLYPALQVTAYATDYSQYLGAVLEDGRRRDDAAHTFAIFLGSTIGNLEPPDAEALLREVRRGLQPGDALLLGADRKKASEILIPAYDDALGVTAAFNLNLLGRINRELGGEFDLRAFFHKAVYDAERGRIEMHLVSRSGQRVRIADLGLEVEFAQDESIHTENSYKFDTEQLAGLAQGAGFSLARTWQDADGLFSLNLLQVEG